MMGWVLVLLPLLAAPALALLVRSGRGHDEGASPRRGLAAGLGAGVMAATAALAAVAAARGWTASLAWTSAGGLGLHLAFSFAASPAAALFAVLVPAVAAPVLAYAAHHEGARGLARLLAVLALFVAAMEVVAGAADLLTLLVGWELIGACSAVLVAHEWWTPGKARSGIVVFLTTRTGDLGLFLALVAAYAGTGSPSYEALSGLRGIPLELVVAGVLTAAAAKSAQVPFAPWLFAAMEGPVSVSTLLHSATMVASGAFLLIRLEPVLRAVPWFGPAALAVGLATALAGGVVALLQPHAKRLLAGSTSAHHGLMFAAVGAGYPAVAALHLVAHACAKAPLFLAAGVAHGCAGTYRLSRLKLGRTLPAVAVASAVAAAALAGIPPLGAAWTKEEVVTAAGHAAPALGWLAALAGALSAAYMARFQLQAFARGRATCEDRAPGAGERWPLYPLAAATAVLGVLWLAPVHGFLARLLPGEVPSGSAGELGLSLALVAGGLAAGRAVARRRPELGEGGRQAAAADWLGLPGLARVAVVRPARGLCHALALFDDRVVDGAVRASAALALGLARLGRRLVEALLDGVPEGLSRLVGRGGAAARRLQTGLTHHYYRLIVAGLAALILVLLLGG